RAEGGDVLLELVEIDAQRRRVELPLGHARADSRVDDMRQHLRLAVPANALGNPDGGRSRSRGGEKPATRSGRSHKGLTIVARCWPAYTNSLPARPSGPG